MIKQGWKLSDWKKRSEGWVSRGDRKDLCWLLTTLTRIMKEIKWSHKLIINRKKITKWPELLDFVLFFDIFVC